MTPLRERIWPSGAAHAALESLLPPLEVPSAPAPHFSCELLERLADAASWTAEYEVEYDYNSWGETYERRYVSNWHEVVAAVLTSLQGATSEGDSPSQPYP